MSKIISVATSEARYEYKQEDIFAYMREKLNWNNTEERKIRFLYDKSGITTRNSVLPDFSDQDVPVLYKPGEKPLVQERLEIFRKEALPLALQAVKKCMLHVAEAKQITHLITVSCTGMSAPGLDIELITELGLASSTERSSVNFMGCYASVQALKQARYITLAFPEAVVLIVSVELCTLHFQNLDDEDNTLANMLFADGAAAVLVVADTFKSDKSLAINHFHSDLLLSGSNDMSWNISDSGFLMTLSAYVPKIISADIRSHFHRLLAKDSLEKDQIDFWAVHPGGKAILEAVARQMEISENKLNASYEVLNNFGNMSSATILFVLERILKDQTTRQGNYIAATAFGPGLTVESVLLEII